MKYSFLVAFVLVPIATWAQNNEPIRVGKGKPPIHKKATPQGFRQNLMNSVNMRGLELASKAVLYQHLNDTIGSQKVVNLDTGDCVVIRATLPRWLVVWRAKSPTQFSTDTTTYYMFKKDVKVSKTFIVL